MRKTTDMQRVLSMKMKKYVQISTHTNVIFRFSSLLKFYDTEAVYSLMKKTSIFVL